MKEIESIEVPERAEIEAAPSEELELQRARAETAKETAKAAEHTRKTEEMRQQAYEVKGRAQITADILQLEAEGVKFYNPSDAARLAERDFKAEFGPDGVTVDLGDGLRVPFIEGLRRVAESKPNFVNTPVIEPRTIRSKSDFESVSQKVAYIKQHGEAAFAALPTNRPSHSGEPQTLEDWFELSPSMKTALIAEKGLEWRQSLRPAASMQRTRAKDGFFIANEVAEAVALKKKRGF